MNLTNHLPAQVHFSTKALPLSAKFWFLVAFIGQWLFVYYVAFFYGPPALDGEFELWNRQLPHGYVEGEPMGNLAVGIHLLFTIIILLGGHLQLIPQVRKAVPVFHRWNGRVFLTSAFVMSLSGLYMVWARGAVGGFIGHVAISINALLIMVFAYFALGTALKKDFKSHFWWTIRLFLVVCGVWFFRIGMMLWLLIHGKPVGFDPETLTGPFITFLIFGQYLIPLAVVELYILVQNRSRQHEKIMMALFLILLTVLTGIGIFGATMGMWLPRVR